MSHLQTVRSLLGIESPEHIPTYNWSDLASRVAEMDESKVYDSLKDDEGFLMKIKEPVASETPDLSEESVENQFERIDDVQKSPYPVVDRELAELHRDLEEGNLENQEYEQRADELLENLQDRYGIEGNALEETERSLDRANTSAYDSNVVFNTVMEDIVHWEELHQGGYSSKDSHDKTSFWMAHEIYNMEKGEN